MKTKSILLIGAGRFGKHLAVKLDELHHEVLAIDNNEERINEILEHVTGAQIGNSTKKEFLETLGVSNFDLCIVAIGGDFQSSLETTSLLKELGAKRIIARTSRDVQEKFLRMAGADEIVYPEKQVANWTAIRFSSDHIFDYMALDEDHAIYEIEVPEHWVGQTIAQVDIRKRYNLNILAIKENGLLRMNISPDMVLTSTETILVGGLTSDIQKCFQI